MTIIVSPFKGKMAIIVSPFKGKMAIIVSLVMALLHLVDHVVEDRGDAQDRDLREAHAQDPVEPERWNMNPGTFLKFGILNLLAHSLTNMLVYFFLYSIINRLINLFQCLIIDKLIPETKFFKLMVFNKISMSQNWK